MRVVQTVRTLGNIEYHDDKGHGLLPKGSFGIVLDGPGQSEIIVPTGFHVIDFDLPYNFVVPRHMLEIVKEEVVEDKDIHAN